MNANRQRHRSRPRLRQTHTPTPCRANARLSGELRRGIFFADAGGLAGVAQLNPRTRWGWDGASLESVSGFSHDPAASSPNLYEYCDDDPLTGTDPNGLQVVVEPEPPVVEPEPLPTQPGTGGGVPPWRPVAPGGPYLPEPASPTEPGGSKPLPYPYPSLPPENCQPKPGECWLTPQPGTEEWEHYVRKCYEWERCKRRIAKHRPRNNFLGLVGGWVDDVIPVG